MTVISEFLLWVSDAMNEIAQEGRLKVALLFNRNIDKFAQMWSRCSGYRMSAKLRASAFQRLTQRHLTYRNSLYSSKPAGVSPILLITTQQRCMSDA